MYFWQVAKSLGFSYALKGHCSHYQILQAEESYRNIHLSAFIARLKPHPNQSLLP